MRLWTVLFTLLVALQGCAEATPAATATPAVTVAPSKGPAYGGPNIVLCRKLHLAWTLADVYDSPSGKLAKAKAADDLRAAGCPEPTEAP